MIGAEVVSTELVEEVMIEGTATELLSALNDKLDNLIELVMRLNEFSDLLLAVVIVVLFFVLCFTVLHKFILI